MNSFDKQAMIVLIVGSAGILALVLYGISVAGWSSATDTCRNTFKPSAPNVRHLDKDTTS
jgi:hypothetical protein